ncbi:hypothetical protein FA15DRAFT_666593 [Coprinopsis marcescibilis]|uniref:Uncharacterized protein n=1 Tax=Coprinopsis marcescibilis TaxID=230819 RepID=A0A5C3L405_COPMA|nr:hypothetical protein FA15DRAFT_666593 [Coprinopsis marcescibilis]
MSLRVTCRSANIAEDADMRDVQLPWSPTSAILKVGRHLSDWVFPKPGDMLQRPSCFYSLQQWSTTDQHHTFLASYSGAPSSTYPDLDDIDMDSTIYHHDPKHLNQLPPEILGEIFLYYLQATEGAPTPTGRTFGNVSAYDGATTSPITLSHVCSYWRSLSLSTPTLWSTISVSLPTPHDIPILETWLSRSMDLPLELLVAQGLGMGSVIQQIVQMFIKEKHRWKRIHLQLDSGCEHLFSDLDTTPFALLEEVGLDLMQWSQQAVSGICRSFYSSRKLKIIRFGKSWDQDAQLFHAPLEQLNFLELNYLSGPQLFPLLCRMPNLRGLAIAFLEGPVEINVTGPLTLPYLQALSVGMVEDTSPILRNLRLPALARLRLYQGFGRHADIDTAGRILCTHLLESGSALQSLHCGELGDHEKTLNEMLASPVISHLTDLIVESRVTDSTLRTLTHQSSTRILPKLKSISLWEVRSSTPATFFSMVQSRRRFSDTLKSVHGVIHHSSRTGMEMPWIPGVGLDIDYYYAQ